MKSFNRKLLAFCSVAALLFIAVISGGCGGSSSTPGSTSVDLNTVLAGGWRMDTSAKNFVSADIYNTPVELIFREFAAKFSSVDVGTIGGTAYFEAVAVISGERVVLPFILDPVSVDVAESVLNNNTWYISNTPLDFAYTLELDNSTSTPKIRLSGFVDLVGDGNYWSYLDVTLSKVTDTTPTNEKMNALIDGTWQTPVTEGTFTGGGFVFVSGDTAEALLMDGMTPIDAVFTNLRFDYTDFASETSEVTNTSLFAFLSNDNEWADTNETEDPVMLIFNDEYVEITRLFGNIYKIVYDDYDSEDYNSDFTDSKAVLMIDDNEKRAYLISSYINYGEDSSYTEIRTVHALEKKPEDSIYTVASQDGTIWDTTSTASATVKILDTSTGEETAPIDIDKIEIIFANYDADSTSLDLKVMVNYYTSESTELKTMSIDLAIDEVMELGYNTWYGMASYGDFTMTFISGDLAIIAVNFELPNTNYYVSCAAFIKLVGNMENGFFSGAWTSTSSDAKVFITSPGWADEVTLSTFGAYFSSVDIEAGTAKFSAFTVLSSDLFLIPVVFDNESVSVDAGAAEDEYIVTSPHGSFTVTRNTSDPDKININGSFDFDLGLTVSIDAAASKIRPNEKLDFDSIMKTSTWQTTPLDAKSGGFAIIGSSSSQMIYPGINYKTFASLAFNGDSTDATVSGFGTMGLSSFDLASREWVDNGYMLPVTLTKESINVDNIFGNYYRFSFESGDSDLKGVFILESESTARMILFADSGSSTAITKLYTVFYLNKITESSTTIDLTAFNNTSWDVTQAGGVAVLPDGNILQITNASPNAHQVRLTNFEVRFTSADLTTQTFAFSASADVEIPAYHGTDKSSVIFENKIVTVEKLGAYMWLGTEGNNEFILTISAGQLNRAAIAGALNFTSPNNANFNVAASILLDLLLKQ